jgi:hypothetical protein
VQKKQNKPPPPDPISAKLSRKHSQVTFMPYGVVLKDERPTSNKKTNMQ